MPVRPLNNTAPGGVGPGLINPGQVGRQELVAPGNVFNALTVLDVPAGLSFFLTFGGNTRVGPITSPISITFQDVPYSDVGEGVWAEVDVAAPGTYVPGWVSYRTPRPGEMMGGIAAQGV